MEYSILVLGAVFFVPFFLLSALGLWVQVRFWSPIAQTLGVLFFNRAAARKVLFRGVLGGDAALQAQVRSYRLCLTLVYAGFFVLIALFLGAVAFVFLGGVLALSYMLTRPYEIEEGRR